MRYLPIFSCRTGGNCMGKIISLKYDFSFKHLFLNEVVRRHFISDALGIPLDDIHSVRLANTFLWKRYRRQKQGILDVVVELNNDSTVNIELQIKMLSYWDRRSLFYWSKLFTEGLLSGQKYDKLKRCICISILDFNLDGSSEYHKVYRLRDETGNEFSDMLEIHVVELNKTLRGTDRMDDWIRLFNVKTEEELEMLETGTNNLGILEAIKEVRIMSLGKYLRLLHEAHLKEIRDRAAREDYVRREGWNAGHSEGWNAGRSEGWNAGRSEGENRINCLNSSLIADKRFEDLERAIKDKEYREQLYKEYGIS